MPGWQCLTAGCNNRTFRRPPRNWCQECQDCRRGVNKRWPKFRFKGKSTANSEGKPDSTRRPEGNPEAAVGDDAQAAQVLGGQEDDNLQAEASSSANAVEVEQSRNLQAEASSSASTVEVDRSCNVQAEASSSARTLEVEQSRSHTRPCLEVEQSRPSNTTAWLAKPRPMDFTAWAEAVEAVHPFLSQVVGRIASHNVLASAQATVAKFRHAKRPIPTDLVTLVGVSIALRGDVDNELQREAWYKFCKVSGRRQKTFESMLIMQLPFSTELPAEASVRQLSCF